MALNFEIVGLDFYNQSKIENLKLAAEYRLKLPTDPSKITLTKLRQLLAIVKKIYKDATYDEKLVDALKQLFFFDNLSKEDADRYPDLIEYKTLIEPYYDTAENTELKSTLDQGTFNLPSGSKAEETHEKLLTVRKQFNQLKIQIEQLDSGNVNNEDSSSILPINIVNEQLNLVQKQLKTLENNLTVNMAEANEQIPLIKPISFSGGSLECVNEFLKRFEIAARCNKWTPATKVSLLPCYTTSYASKWIFSYLEDNPNVNFETLAADLKKAFGFSNQKFDLQQTLEDRVQCESESPCQYFYVIKDLCRKINPNMSDQEVIQFTTRGLLPRYFDTLMYMEHETLNEFQKNLAKIESKLYQKNVNSKKHHLNTSSLNSQDNAFLLQNVSQETAQKSDELSKAKLVRFDAQTEIVNVLTDLQNKIKDLEIGGTSNRRSRSRERSFSPKHDRSNLNYDRPKFDYKRQNSYSNRSHSPSPYRNYRNNSRTRLNHDNRNYSSHNNSYRVNRPFHNNYNKKHDVVYNCQICKMNNHHTDECGFNLRSHNFNNNTRGQQRRGINNKSRGTFSGRGPFDRNTYQNQKNEFTGAGCSSETLGSQDKNTV